MSFKFTDISSYMKTKGISKTCYVPSSTCPILCNTVNNDLTIHGNLNVDGNIFGYVKDTSFVLLNNHLTFLDSSVNHLENDFYNIYNTSTNSFDVSYALFYNDVSINGLLQVGNNTTLISDKQIKLNNVFDISNNLDFSGNIIISNNNILKTSSIHPLSTNGIIIQDSSQNISILPSGIHIQTTNTDNIILDSKKNLELQVDGHCFIKLDASGIRLKKDIISSSNGLKLIKDNNNNQLSRLFGEIITILDISAINIPIASSTTITSSLDYNSGFSNGIVFSNSDASSNLYYNNPSTGNLVIDVSNNKNHFIDSFFEIYLTLNVISGSPNTSVQSYFDLSGVYTQNRFTVDTRSYSIKDAGTLISATYGPKQFLTGSDGLLNDVYKLVAHIDTDKNNVIFNGIRLILKQRIL